MLFTCQSTRSTPIISSIWIRLTFVPFPQLCLRRRIHGLFSRCNCSSQCWFRCLGVGARAAEYTEAKTSISRLVQLVERATELG